MGKPGTTERVSWCHQRRAPRRVRRSTTERALVDAERLFFVFGPLSLAMTGGAVVALVVGWVRPAPWLLALLLVAILSTLWSFAVSRFMRADALGEP